MSEKPKDLKKIETRVIELIGEQAGISAKDIKLDSDLRNDLGIDSFAAVELAFRLKEEFDVPISNIELPKLRTVNDIVEGIKKSINK